MALTAIIGRPNVGKSTFFNRITGTRQAITSDEAGVTRDRVYGHVEWNGRGFSVVDTGGYVPRSAERYEAAIREQVEIALDEADLVLFMVDVTTGITDLDQEMAGRLRRSAKKVVVIANKADNQERRWEASDFYRLGLGEVHPVSSTNGMGTGDLLDEVVGALPAEAAEEPVDERTRIAVVGRPNVGKSSLVNALLGHDRALVTEESGTTRDAVHSEVVFEGEELVLVDTAGLRKRPKVKENIEFYAALRSERAIEQCDVAVVVLDATRGLEKQDLRILRQADEQKKGLLLAINKWDLVEKDASTMRRYKEYFRQRLGGMDHLPMRFISAKTGQRIYTVLEEALAVAERRRGRVETSTLNEVVQEAVAGHHPPSYRGHHVKINYATQAEAAPPVFVFFANYPQGIRAGYRRYLEGKLREAFDLAGVPLVLKFRRK